ncbi:hypothetical protein FNF28_05390 [Cafeteria roenbergensis]|uniref:Receptor ligand binding region domain-containing protein n=1 Tax=Cafeteria roenbergensis TaxID=33653 RepID=A0A5A8D540_CAFRO|nr:hypothetical protein FNF28_05390 [Cafeteria roenbergensis]
MQARAIARGPAPPASFSRRHTPLRPSSRPARSFAAVLAVALSLASCAAAVAAAETGQDAWPVAGIAPVTGEYSGIQILEAMRLATVHLNAQWGNGSLWPGCNISVSDVDSEGVPDIAALKCFKEALLPRPPSMFVGGRRSDVTTSVALIGRVTQTPTLSYSATSVGLTGLSRFARVVGSDGLQAKAILGFMCALRPRWREAVAITASSDYASSLVIALRAMADAQGVSISLEQHVPVAAAPLRDVLASINSVLDRVVTRNARVIILNDEPADARLVLSEARRRGMIGLDQAPGSPYVWIGTDYWASEDAMFAAGNLTRLAQAGCPAACAERLLEALPGCFATWQSTRAIAPWLGPWQASVWDPAVGPDQLTPRQKAISELSSWRGDNMDTKAPFAFDAVLLAAAAMRRACEASGVPLASTGCGACASAFKDGDLMFNAMIGGSARPAFLVANATGPVFLDENGDRPMAVSLQQFTRVPNLTIPLDKVHVGELPVAAGPGEGCDGMVLQEAAIRWPGGRSTPPGTLGPCPPGQALSTGPFGAAYCGECPAGRFNMDLSSNCRPCPGVGAICPGGDAVELKVGFWSSPLRNGTVELYDCRPIPGICCPSSRCEVGRAMVDRPWGSSQCGPNRLGRLCAGCREGLSLWGGICLRCVGVNIVVLSLLCLLALVGLGLVTALVPSERAVMKNTIDYVQLIALVLVPVPGGRLPSLAALLESNVFNLDISSIFGEGDSGDGGWPANGSFPLVEPPLPPPSLYCPMPLTPLASSLVPLALPLSLLALILLMGFCWRPSADRVCPSSLRACLPGCAACFVEVPSWLLPGSRLVWMVAAPGDVRRVRTSSGPAMVLASLAEPGGDESDGSLASRPDQAVLALDPDSDEDVGSTGGWMDRADTKAVWVLGPEAEMSADATPSGLPVPHHGREAAQSLAAMQPGGGGLDPSAAPNPAAMRRRLRNADRLAVPRLEPRSGHMQVNAQAAELIAGACCWWHRLAMEGACRSCFACLCCSFAGRRVVDLLGPISQRAARRRVRQGHWAYVRSKTVLRAGLRWATVSANVVTATGWGLLACREVDGVQVLELHPAVQCWTPQHIFAVTTMAGFIALFALGLPGFLILAYEWLDKRSAAWEAWRDRRTRFIVRQNALRGHGVMDLFAVRLSRSDVLAAKRHHASEKEEQEEQEATSDSQAGRRERARRAGAARHARSTDAESGSSDDDEAQNAATGVSTPPGLVAAVSGAGRATSPSGVKRHTSAAAVAGTTRLAALPGDRLAGSVAGSPLSEDARHGKESTAFAAAASAGDLELVSSLGRAVWEVMRVYRPGVRGSYEAFVFVRRVLVTSAVVFLATNPTWRQIALFVLSTFFLVIQLLLMPYSTASDNLYASGLLLAMTFICGLEMYNTPLYLSDPNHAASTAALIIAVTEFALLLVPVAIAGTVMIATLRRKGHLACLGRPCQPSGAPCCRPRAGSDAIELSEAPRDTSSLRGVQPGWSVNRE